MKRCKNLRYNAFYFFNYHLFYKFLWLFMLRGKKFYQERFFIKLLFLFRFLFKKPLFFFFKLLKNLMPAVGYRKKERFMRRRKISVEVAVEGSKVVKKIPPRKFGFKKDPNQPKEKKVQEKRGSGGRAKKGLFVLPWICSNYKKILISFIWLKTEFFRKDAPLHVNLGRQEKRIRFFNRMSTQFFFFQNKDRLYKLLTIKRRLYKILYKTRIGLHFRW